MSGRFRFDCDRLDISGGQVRSQTASRAARYRATVSRTVTSLPALVICGPPASGKSTLAREIASRLRAALLDQDVLTGPLTAVVAQLIGFEDLDVRDLATATRAARYETLAAGATDNLQAGSAVVLVAPYSIERRDVAAWNLLTGRLASAGGATAMVWLRVTGELVLARMATRAAGRDLAKLDDPATYLARADLGVPIVPHIAVDATASLEEQCRLVLANIP